MNIYVGNLVREVTEHDLKEAFKNYGEVISVKIIKDPYSGESKGFGFVEMPNNAQARKAMNELSGTSLKGKPIRVNEARPRTQNRYGNQRRW